MRDLIGEAGFEKPHDCRVEVLLSDSGGLKIELHSKLSHMFGQSMRESAKVTLAEMNVNHGTIEIYDCGSLDFVIMSRIKTAVRRARAQKETEHQPEGKEGAQRKAVEG